ncbi:MAG: tRNA ((37)-N1)-methyltransferase TrmD, partial [Actinomycetota bacterium]
EYAKTKAEVMELSIGDYVLNGGEVAAVVMIEAICRLIPGVIGNSESLDDESHADGLLEYPSFTKPQSWRGLEVPQALLSGHHAEIEAWRRQRSLQRTEQNRPDLL